MGKIHQYYYIHYLHYYIIDKSNVLIIYIIGMSIINNLIMDINILNINHHYFIIYIYDVIIFNFLMINKLINILILIFYIIIN